MKFWSIFTLICILNFTALPSIAAVAGWKIPRTNVIVNEEETHSHYASFTVYEKTLPKTLNVHDFLKFFELDSQHENFAHINDSSHRSPLLSIFSPPPEI